MRNFEITKDESGQEWMWLYGKLHPCKTLTLTERFKNPEAFQLECKRIHEDAMRRLAQSELAAQNIYWD